jgi:hypothetical protein
MLQSQCPRCLVQFSRPQRLRSHMAKKNLCQPISSENECNFELASLLFEDEIGVELIKKDQPKKYICDGCQIGFTRKSNLERHEQYYCHLKKQFKKDQCVNKNEDNELIISLAEKIKQLEKRLEDNYLELKDKPSNIHNNILQVVCIGGNQNYLDMLTEQWGDYDRALTFIKDCALSHLTGDCKLIQKIYFENNEIAPIKYLDKSRNKLEYMNENKEKVIDHRGQKLGRILANNLQNSYLKGVNYLINRNLLNNQCPNKFLDEYDVQSWNNHIYELSDVKYQRKMISNLEIPIQV